MNKSIFVMLVIIAGIFVSMTITDKQAQADQIDASSTRLNAGSWYVSPGGNDSDTCLSPAEPCGTINSVLSKPGFVVGDTIYVETGIYTATTGAEVVLLNKSVILSGGWDSAFELQSGFSTIDGDNKMRGVLIHAGSIVQMERFVIQNGFIYEEDGSGIRNLGDLTLTNSSVQYNQAGMKDEPGGAPGIYNAGNLAIQKSSIHHNFMYNQYHCDGGGIYNNGGNVEITDSSITHNFSTEYGGGIYNTNGGTLVITNSTISKNQAIAESGGGGIHNGITNPGVVYLNSSTVSNNIGIGLVTITGGITMKNTILAGNLSYDKSAPFDCKGVISSLGYNLVGSTSSCDFAVTTGDLLNENPLLSILTGNPAFQPVYSESPAIDAGNPAGCTDQVGNPLPTDQRGIARVGRCDIGSYEYDLALDPIHTNFMCFIENACLPVFFDNFKNPASGWPIEDTGSVLYEYKNGEYRILLRNKYWSAGVDSGINMRWFETTVDVRNVSGIFGSYGIIFEINYDLNEFMTLEIYPDGWYGIYHYHSYGWELVAEDYSSAIHQGTAINRISIKLSDPTRMEVYANGQLITDFMYNGLIWGGNIGIVAFSYDLPYLDIRFDNFTIDSIKCSDLEPHGIQRSESPVHTEGQWIISGEGQNLPSKHQP